MTMNGTGIKKATAMEKETAFTEVAISDTDDWIILGSEDYCGESLEEYVEVPKGITLQDKTNVAGRETDHDTQPEANSKAQSDTKSPDPKHSATAKDFPGHVEKATTHQAPTATEYDRKGKTLRMPPVSVSGRDNATVPQFDKGEYFTIRYKSKSQQETYRLLRSKAQARENQRLWQG
jgi:hypothetical protein